MKRMYKCILALMLVIAALGLWTMVHAVAEYRDRPRITQWAAPIERTSLRPAYDMEGYDT